MTSQLPTADLACKLAAAATGARSLKATRFSTGLHHYVFDVEFENHPPVVARIATPENRGAMEGAFTLSNRLRPLGVPLPEILAADLAHDFPYLILERFPGTDLKYAIHALSSHQQWNIASAVASAQGIVASLPSAGRYGYAESPEAAPHARWSAVLDQRLDFVRRGIAAAGLFDLSYPQAIAALINGHRDELDSFPATPFLHDTTTKNVIVAPDGTFSGIVDVDNLCFGDPRSAPALTMASLANMGVATGYVDAWMSEAGYSDDRIFRLYAAFTAVIFMSEHGQMFNGNIVSSTPQERDHLCRIADAFIAQACS